MQHDFCVPSPTLLLTLAFLLVGSHQSHMPADWLSQHSWHLEMKGLLMLCMELSVLLSSEPGNQVDTRGKQKSSQMEDLASPSTNSL